MVLQATMTEAMRRAATAVAIATDPETAARASIGQEPRLSERHYAVAKAVMVAITSPTDDMIAVGEQWRSHCSDTDSLFEQMMLTAIHGR
jgi:hypothetical protein